MLLLALRDLQWRRRRFMIAVAATGLVFSISLLLAGVSTTVHDEPKQVVDAVDADAWVVAKGASGPFTTPEVFPASVAAEVEGIPGVRAADPFAVLHTSIEDGGLRDINLIGVRIGGVGTPDVDEGRAPRRSNEVIVDRALGVDVGDEITVSGRRLEVVGEASGITYLFGTPTVFAPLRDLQELGFGGQPLAMATVTRGVPDSAPGGFKVMFDDAVADDLDRQLANGTETIDFLNILLFVVAGGIVGSMVYLSALERTRDFAVLKATGAGNGGLLAGLALQAVILSTVAVAAAAVLARVLAPAFPFEVQLTGRSLARLAVIAIAIGLVASAIGFRRVARTDPALAFG